MRFAKELLDVCESTQQVCELTNGEITRWRNVRHSGKLPRKWNPGWLNIARLTILAALAKVRASDSKSCFHNSSLRMDAISSLKTRRTVFPSLCSLSLPGKRLRMRDFRQVLLTSFLMPKLKADLCTVDVALSESIRTFHRL